jgi:hypothetical protein
MRRNTQRSQSEALITAVKDLLRRYMPPHQKTGELSGHSFRVGAALDLLNKNIPLEKIMLRGGWKSEASAMRYLQGWIIAIS